METVSQSGLLLWDRTVLKSVRSGPVPVPRSGLASLVTMPMDPLQPVRIIPNLDTIGQNPNRITV